MNPKTEKKKLKLTPYTRYKRSTAHGRAAKWAQLKTFQGRFPSSRGRNTAVTVVYVPEYGLACRTCALTVVYVS